MSPNERGFPAPGARSRATDLATEAREVQNPALGAVLLWRAASAHRRDAASPAPCPVPALYLVLPIVLHGPTLRQVLSTKPASGLRKFASKFSDSKAAQTDMLLDLHPRARAMRGLTTDALRVAVTAGLIEVVPADAVARAVERRPPTGLARPIADLVRGAERVGQWFAPLTLGEIAFTLNVRF